jgi:hypothetical protein
MSAMSHRKGGRAEAALVEALRAAGWITARRNFRSGAHGGGDITGGPTDTHWECKCVEALNVWKALDQAQRDARPTDLPVVAFKRNRSSWYAAIPLNELLALLALRDTT